MRCDTVSAMLAGIADGLEKLPPDAERHVESCLRCQAELVQYRKLLRALTSMREQYVLPDDQLLSDILVAIRPPATVHRINRLRGRNRKAAYIGGIAAAAATAGAAGAIVIAARLASRQSLAS